MNIHLKDTNGQTYTAYASPTDSVESLESVIPSPRKCKLMCNNQILIGAFSLQYYEITEESQISIIRPIQEPQPIKHRHYFSDVDKLKPRPTLLQEFSESLANKSTLREATRVLDLSHLRHDSCLFSVQSLRLQSSVCSCARSLYDSPNLPLVIPTSKFDRPSESSLPKLW